MNVNSGGSYMTELEADGWMDGLMDGWVAFFG